MSKHILTDSVVNAWYDAIFRSLDLKSNSSSRICCQWRSASYKTYFGFYKSSLTIESTAAFNYSSVGLQSFNSFKKSLILCSRYSALLWEDWTLKPKCKTLPKDDTWVLTMYPSCSWVLNLLKNFSFSKIFSANKFALWGRSFLGAWVNKAKQALFTFLSSFIYYKEYTVWSRSLTHRSRFI